MLLIHLTRKLKVKGDAKISKSEKKIRLGKPCRMKELKGISVERTLL